MNTLTLPLPHPLVPRLAACGLALAVALLARPAAAEEIVIFDAEGDFASTYVGERNRDLDIDIAGAYAQGDALHLFSLQDNLIGITEAPAYVWAINRGSGALGLGGAAGAGIAFDALVVLTSSIAAGDLFEQRVSALVTTFGAAGPVTTDITARGFVNWDTIGAFVPLALLPSTGFALEDYQVNLWTLDGAGAGPDHIADFAVDGGMFGVNVVAAVPEPSTWALMITGFGLAGAALRRRRTTSFA